MTAWRMWVKPDGSSKFTTFFIKDGSQEVFCWILPDLLTETEECILEVPLADRSYLFRENNGAFGPEGCAEFGCWIAGPYTFSIDDVMLVDNPALPAFFKTTPPAVRPREWQARPLFPAAGRGMAEGHRRSPVLEDE